MNDRIKAMWEEATYSIWPRPGKFTAGEYDTHLEKFAELIVKECLEMCKTSVGNADYNTGRLHCLENIKEHFGLK